MVVLDITVVNVALPSIGSDLNFAGADLQWVVTAYDLFAGGLLLLGGRAADVLGRRAVFVTGLALFTTGSRQRRRGGGHARRRHAHDLGRLEWVFLVNVPVGIAVGALAARMLPLRGRARNRRGGSTSPERRRFSPAWRRAGLPDARARSRARVPRGVSDWDERGRARER